MASSKYRIVPFLLLEKKQINEFAMIVSKPVLFCSSTHALYHYQKEFPIGPLKVSNALPKNAESVKQTQLESEVACHLQHVSFIKSY